MEWDERRAKGLWWSGQTITSRIVKRLVWHISIRIVVIVVCLFKSTFDASYRMDSVRCVIDGWCAIRLLTLQLSPSMDKERLLIISFSWQTLISPPCLSQNNGIADLLWAQTGFRLLVLAVSSLPSLPSLLQGWWLLANKGGAHRCDADFGLAGRFFFRAFAVDSPPTHGAELLHSLQISIGFRFLPEFKGDSFRSLRLSCVSHQCASFVLQSISGGAGFNGMGIHATAFCSKREVVDGWDWGTMAWRKPIDFTTAPTAGCHLSWVDEWAWESRLGACDLCTTLHWLPWRLLYL